VGGHRHSRAHLSRDGDLDGETRPPGPRERERDRPRQRRDQVGEEEWVDGAKMTQGGDREVSEPGEGSPLEALFELELRGHGAE
jgi:hypothetical protein